MRTVKPGIEAVKFLGEDYYVPIVCFRDQGDAFHMTEILRLGQGDLDSISRVDAIRDEVFALHAGDSWIFDAELFLPGNQEGRRIGGEMESVAAACQPNDGPPGA